MCVPKHDLTDLRIVHDLSFPEGSSVYDSISKGHYLEQYFNFRLPGVDRLVEFINDKGRGCHVFKKDLRRAYRQIPVDPGDYPLLGMSVDGSLFFHTSLPFGLCSETLICQRTTKSVVHILSNKGFSVDVYIDDLYGAEPPVCSQQAFQRMNSLFNDLGLMASPEKEVPPCHHMCLGCGAICFREYFHCEFPDFIPSQDLHINELELLTVVIAIKLWSRKLGGLKVELLSDNTTCVSVINSQYSTNPFMQQCLRELWVLLALFNIQLVVRHVRGCDNWLADSLSRFHTGDFSVQFHALSTSLQLSECFVPDSLFHFTIT